MKHINLLFPEQKEDVRHGDYIFPVQNYLGTISSTYPLIAPHWHEEAELTLIVDGHCIYHFYQNDYLMEAGDLIFIPPTVLHSAFQTGDEVMHSETYVFHLNFLGENSNDVCSIKYLTPLLNHEYLLPSIIKKNHPAYPSLKEIFLQISSLYTLQPLGYELALKACFLQAVFLLLPYGEENTVLSSDSLTGSSEKAKTVLNYIEAHYSESFTIKELAALCYFSESHFMRFFKKHTGMTCLEYINNLRLEKAAQLFQQGNSSIIDVSLSVGFVNLSYFHRAFKKQYGMTPRTYLMQHVNTTSTHLD